MTSTLAVQSTAEDLRKRQIVEFLSRSDWGGATLEPLKGDASFRRYIRVRKGGETAMLMDAPPEKEDILPYINVARHLCSLGYSAPRVIAEDTVGGFVLSEDLGDNLYSGAIARDQNPDFEQKLYDAAVDVLAAWHAQPEMHKRQSDFRLPDYDLSVLMREVRLLSDWFLPAIMSADEAASLGEEYAALWESVFERMPPVCDMFVHRDYHADNLLWLPRRLDVASVGLLDFQDALWGHPAYDLVSLLEDARRDVRADIVQRALLRYAGQTGMHLDELLAAYSVLGAQRNCKIIGIFVRLSRRDGKHHYLKLLPRVWAHLERDLSHPLLAGVRMWMERHVPLSQRMVSVPA